MFEHPIIKHFMTGLPCLLFRPGVDVIFAKLGVKPFHRIPLKLRAGFTVVELLAVAILIATIVDVVLPSSDAFFSNQKIAAQGAVLTSDVRYARSCAMETQVYHRLVFSSDKTKWIVQRYCDAAGNDKPGEVDAADIGTTIGKSHYYEETNVKWQSVVEGDSREIEPTVELEFQPTTPRPIFFRPDGFLADSPTFTGAPVGITTVKFKSGPAEMQVDITAAGAIESLEWFDENY